jgi:DNA replication factor GINS
MVEECPATVIEEGLRLARLAYESSTVRVMVLKDAGRVVVGDSTYELRKGTELELPRWLAKLLAEEGVVELLETPLSLNDIARAHFSATSASTVAELEQLPRDFYQQVAEYIRNLDTRVRREFDPALLEERHKASQYVKDIASKRVGILLRALRSPTAIGELRDKLTPEEQVLFNTLSLVLETWVKGMEELIGG